MSRTSIGWVIAHLKPHNIQDILTPVVLLDSWLTGIFHLPWRISVYLFPQDAYLDQHGNPLLVVADASLISVPWKLVINLLGSLLDRSSDNSASQWQSSAYEKVILDQERLFPSSKWRYDLELFAVSEYSMACIRSSEWSSMRIPNRNFFFFRKGVSSVLPWLSSDNHLWGKRTKRKILEYLLPENVINTRQIQSNQLPI